MKKLFFAFSVLLFSVTISMAQRPVGTKIGHTAPDLTGKTPTGEVIKLSDTRGQLVLLDFWAAWCPPCRRENPNLVATYNKFKDKNFSNGDGFTVFGVSLDRTASAWEKAIKDDKLDWPYHISDLQYWNSKHAAIYGVRSIPSNFLIDGEGTIIATGLRGPALDAAIEKYLK